MNNMIKIFESKEFGKVRTVVRNGETWWILKDICRVLEMKAKDGTPHYLAAEFEVK